MLTRWLFGIAVSFLMWAVPEVVVGQEIVTSRSESNNGNWGDGAPFPWYWEGVDEERGDPDDDGNVANFIFIGHNENLSMTLNGRNYRARYLTFQEDATSPRTFGGLALEMHPNGGNCKIENLSPAEHTFNIDIELFGVTELNPVNGDLTFNEAIITNDNFIDVYGEYGNTLTINGVINGTSGIAIKQNSTVLLVGDQTYAGGTFVEAGTLTLGGAASSNTITGDISITGGTFNYVGTPNNFQIDPASSINLESGTLNFGPARDDVASITMTGGNLLRGGNWITLNGPSSFTGGSIVLSAGSSRIENQAELILGDVSFDYSASTDNNGALSVLGDVLVQDNATPVFTISNAGDPAIRLNNAARTFDIGSNAILTIDWAFRSETASQGSIRKTGAGKILLNGQTEYTGQTIIEAGTIEVGSDERIDDLSSLVMEGGTFSTGVPAGYNETIGELDLQENSTIALGTGSHELNFAPSNGVAWNPGAVLTITGWSGSLGQSGTAGQIFVGTDENGLTQEQLNQIEFDGQGFAILLPTGELVPRNPTFTVSETYLLPFSTPEGAPSDPAVFEVEGTSLTNDITINAPAGFELSLNAGGPYSNPLTISVPDLAGDLPATQIFTRLTGTTQGNFSGDLTVGTSGLSDQTVAVAGRVLTLGSSIIKFDDENWTAGTVGNLTTYATDHTYTEQDWLFTGGDARRNDITEQDGFPGAYGTYSWRLRDGEVTWTGTFTNSGTINAFGFKVRRWDGSPPPNYEVAYSTNGGSSFTPVETINNTFLNNSSQWVVFEHELSTPTSIGANDFVLRLSQTTGERIFIDDFSFDITPDACENTTWYYRSVASGSFTNKNSWEKSPNGLDSWAAADCPPSDEAAEVIIRDGHVLTLSTDLSLPDVIIEGNAELIISAGIIDLSAGSVTIQTNGVLDFDGGGIPTFPALGVGIDVAGTLRVSTAVSQISNELAGNLSSGKVQYAHQSIFEWNTSGAGAFNTANQTYFPDADDVTIPIFYVPQSPGVVGAGTTTTINGILDVDGSLTWTNSGDKQIRNGITGIGTIRQSSTCGVISLFAPTVELEGSGTLFLNNNGLLIPDGVTVNLGSDKPISNEGALSGKIEINGVLNDNGFGLPGNVDSVVIGSTAVINCSNQNGLIATTGTFGNTTGTYTIDPNSLVDYQHSGNQDITTLSDYGNLTIRGSGIKTVLGDSTAVLGDVLMSESAVISAVPGAELSFAGNMDILGTVSFDNGAYDNLSLSTFGDNAQIVTGNSDPIRCLSFTSDKGAGSLVFNTVTAVEVKGEWNSNYYGTGDFVNNGATLQVGGDMRIRGGDVDRYSITGTIRLTGETGVSQVFRGTDDTSVSAVIENLIVGGSGSPNVDLTSNGDYIFTGDISIENGQLNAFGNQINLAGNWTNYGEAGFNEDLARLNLNGSTDQLITCPGGEVFSSITVENSTGNIVLNDNLSVKGIDSEIIDLNVGATIDLGGNTFSFCGNNEENPGTFLRVSDGNVLITGVTGSMFEVVNGRKKVLSLNSGALEFAENVTVNAKDGIDFASGGVSTIKGALEIDAGGFVLTNPPVYFTGSTLRYQSGGDYNRNAEWNSLAGEGLPHHIEITNSTDVFMSNFALPDAVGGRLEIAGDLTIDNGKLYMGNNLANGLDVKGGVTIVGTSLDSLYLGDNIGGDIRIGKDLVVAGSGALFQNTREVEMNGTGNTQNITGVDSFDYLAINNSGGTVFIDQETTIGQRLRLLDGVLDNSTHAILMSDGSLISRTAASATMSAEPTVVGGDQFNIEYSGASFPTGNEFPLANTAVANLSVIGPIATTLSGDRAFNGDLVLNNSIIDLNGNIFTARGNASTGNFAGKVIVDGGGARNIVNSAGTQAYFDITGMGGVESEFYTKQVESLNSTSLVFEDDVTVRLGNGGVDFGTGNPTTIEGVLEVSAGGFVINNSCYYAANSILRFANGFSYVVDGIDKTWDSGDIASGNPGIPYNVESSGDASTNLELNSPRSLRKNLTIDGSQFTLTTNSGTFEIGGNWNRSGASSEFNHNDQEVIFNGADPQTITTIDVVPSEVFYKLTFSGAGLKTLNEDVTVEHNITIDGTGGLNLNSQTIFLSGDWINAAGESAFNETGRVELLGSVEQTITCSGGEKFDTLRVNNSSELSEGISLINPVEISGELILERGLIHNHLGQDITLTTTATTNGGDYRSYVTGRVVKDGFSSLDMVEFPVGYFDLNGGDTISVWQRAGLTPQTADGTVFSVQYFHENAVPGTSYPSNPPEVLAPLVAASTCNYWDIGRLSGNTDAKVRLHWNDSTTCFDINDIDALDVAHLDSLDVWESVGVLDQNVGYVESVFVSDFSPFTIGTSEGINVLPITLLDFSAEAKENTVDVRWTTSSEINNDFFTVERSLDAEHFEAIGTVDGAGNSNTPLYYNFSDDAPYSGISFYRLKQTDYDGTTTYSDIRMVRMDTDGSFELLKVFRAQDGLQLHYRSEVSLLDVEIIDLTGKRLYRKQIQNAGTTVIHPNLARGVYLLRINNGTEFKVGKFFY